MVGRGAPIPVLEVGLITAGAGFGLLSAPLAGEVSGRFSDVDRSVALGMYNLAFFIGSASGGAIATGFVQAGLEASTSWPGGCCRAPRRRCSSLRVLPVVTLAGHRFMRDRHPGWRSRGGVMIRA